MLWPNPSFRGILWLAFMLKKEHFTLTFTNPKHLIPLASGLESVAWSDSAVFTPQQHPQCDGPRGVSVSRHRIL